MRLGKTARRIVPRFLRQRIEARLDALRREWKRPRIDLGYRDSTGIWRAETRISDTAFFDYPERIRIGERVFVGHYCVLDGVGGLDIGDGCQFAAHAAVFTHSSHVAIRLYGMHYNDSLGEHKTAYGLAPVRIGKYTFVGSGARILPGVTLGHGVVVAAGAVVSQDVEAFQIVAGVPARPAGDARELDRPHLDDPQLRRWYEEWQ
jgi:acetyltransferase-like isoleucine patch superfamily enzyme